MLYRLTERYIILVVFGMIQFSIFVTRLSMLSKVFLITVQLGYVNRTCTDVVSPFFNHRACSSSQKRMHHFISPPLNSAALHCRLAIKPTLFMRTNIFTKSLCSKKVYITRSFLYANINLHLSHSIHFSISRFVYFSALANHLCRISLRKSDDTATAGIYSVNEFYNRHTRRALYH